MSNDPSIFQPITIDIIVPVYLGFTETRRCIKSLFHNRQQTPFEIIVIEDASPEPALVDYLNQLAENQKITLLRNPHNLGFVKTANRGLKLHPARDVILLNSDTEVSGNWLDRLTACAYADPMIGTVTPFSNNATICSYPRFCENNELPPGLSLKEIDDLCRQANAGSWLEIPTAVGFCMYIRRACIDAIGCFDEQHFGLGYGEENDFCMRAIAAGWRNVLCADTFVYHVGEVSFGDRRKEAHREKGMASLLSLHPHYSELVETFIERDPVQPKRAAIDHARVRWSTEQALQVTAERDQTIAVEKEKHRQATRSIAQLGNDLVHAHDTLQKLTTQFHEAEQFVRAREADIANLEEMLTEARTFVRDRDADIAQLTEQIQQVKQLAINRQAEIERLQAELSKCMAELNQIPRLFKKLANSKSIELARHAKTRFKVLLTLFTAKSRGD